MAEVQENETIIEELKEKLDKQGKEISSLVQNQKLCQREISGLMKELESDLSLFNVKLDEVCSGRGATGQQAENIERENQVSKLEEIAKEMDKEMSQLYKNGVIEQDELVFEVPKIRGLIVQVNNLKLNLDCLINAEKVSRLQQEEDMKKKLDEELSYRDKEINELGEEKASLQAKISELEITLTERDNQIEGLQRKNETGKNESSYLQEELSVERAKLQERLNELENHNNELRAKVSDQQKLLKKQDETINKLKADCKMVQGRFLQAADRKIDEMAEEFKKKFEDKLRILCRRIRVSEQLQSENKESWKRMKEDCEQNHPGIGNRLSQILRNEAEQRAVSQAIDKMMKGMECSVSDFRSKEGCYLQRLSRLSDEIQVVKNRVNKPLKIERESSEVQHKMEEKEQDEVKKEKVQYLEDEVKKEKMDKMKLTRQMSEVHHKVAELEKAIVEKDKELSRQNERQGTAVKPKMEEKEQDKVMKEKVKRLEERLDREKIDKLKLTREISEMQNKIAELEKVIVEKDEELLQQKQAQDSEVKHKEAKEQDEAMEKIDTEMLTKGMSEMQNKVDELEKGIVEKDEELLKVENEKVEAIRQLCMWVDYHQSRFDELKEEMVKKAKGRGRA